MSTASPTATPRRSPAASSTPPESAEEPVPVGAPVAYHGSVSAAHGEYIVIATSCFCGFRYRPGAGRYQLATFYGVRRLMHVRRESFRSLLPPGPVWLPRRPHERLTRVDPPGTWAVSGEDYLRQVTEWVTADGAYRVVKVRDTSEETFFELHPAGDSGAISVTYTLREVRDMILALRLTGGATIRLDTVDGWIGYTPEYGVTWCRPIPVPAAPTATATATT